MGRISNRVNQINKAGTYATSSEIRSHIGRPMAPCLRCGSPVLAVLHSGELSCPDCQPGLARALLLAVVDGQAVELDRDLNVLRTAGGATSAQPTVAEPTDPALAAVLAWLESSIVELVFDPTQPAGRQALWSRPGMSARRQAELVDAMDERHWKPRAAAKMRLVCTRNPNFTK